MPSTTTKVAITFPKTLVKKAAKYSYAEYGIKFPELVRHLLIDYVDSKNGEIEVLDEKTIKQVGKAIKNIKQGKYVVVDPDDDNALNKVLGIKK